MTWAAAAAPAVDCAAEATVLVPEESELPRLEVASPADRPPYCITLETIMAFAGRVKAHAALPEAGSRPGRRRMGQDAGGVLQIVQSAPVQANALAPLFPDHRANITGFAESPAINRADRRDAPRSPTTSSTLPAKLREGLGRTAHRWY